MIFNTCIQKIIPIGLKYELSVSYWAAYFCYVMHIFEMAYFCLDLVLNIPIEFVALILTGGRTGVFFTYFFVVFAAYFTVVKSKVKIPEIEYHKFFWDRNHEIKKKLIQKTRVTKNHRIKIIWSQSQMR